VVVVLDRLVLLGALIFQDLELVLKDLNALLELSEVLRRILD
jgi:hypothetical protein